MYKYLLSVFFTCTTIFAYPYVYEEVTPYAVDRHTIINKTENYIEYVPVQRQRTIQVPVTVRDYYQDVRKIVVNEIMEKQYIGSETIMGSPDVMMVPGNFGTDWMSGRIYMPNPDAMGFGWYNFQCNDISCSVPGTDLFY